LDLLGLAGSGLRGRLWLGLGPGIFLEVEVLAVDIDAADMRAIVCAMRFHPNLMRLRRRDVARRGLFCLCVFGLDGVMQRRGEPRGVRAGLSLISILSATLGPASAATASLPAAACDPLGGLEAVVRVSVVEITFAAEVAAIAVCAASAAVAAATAIALT
jgi:hypothetical protein